MVCTFFGHRDCPAWVEKRLEVVVEDLICTQNVDVFYVGNQGAFDKIAQRVICRAKTRHSFVSGYIVLQGIPRNTVSTDMETLVPEGMENVPPRFAIYRRNRWMVEHSDMVVAYVVRAYGGAAQFVSAAQKANKHVIFLESKEPCQN